MCWRGKLTMNKKEVPGSQLEFQKSIVLFASSITWRISRKSFFSSEKPLEQQGELPITGI
jgi:hypothetical protein